MADRVAWLRWAWLSYHAGTITTDELQAMIREHQAAPDGGIVTPGP